MSKLVERVSKFAVGCCVSLFGLAVAFVFVEVGLRLFVSMSQSAVKWDDRPKFYFGHLGQKNLQDYPYSSEKPVNTFRIGIVGDSYTFAPFMQFTDAFPKILERMLNLNETAMRGEVINYGVPAYSADHETAVIRKAYQEGADLVILQITLNDAELKPLTPTGIRKDMPDRFGELQPTDRQRKIFGFSRLAELVVRRLHNTSTHRNYVDYFYEVFNHPRGWRMFVSSISRMREIAQRHDKPFVAVVFPIFGIAVDDNYPFFALHKKITDQLEQLGVPFLDLAETYRDIPVDRLQVWPGVDRHPNEIAHRMAAEEMYIWLVENNLIPQDLKIQLMHSTRLGINPQPEYSGPGSRFSVIVK